MIRFLAVILFCLIGVALVADDVDRINRFVEYFNVWGTRQNEGVEDVKARARMLKALRDSGLCEAAKEAE